MKKLSKAFLLAPELSWACTNVEDEDGLHTICEMKCRGETNAATTTHLIPSKGYPEGVKVCEQKEKIEMKLLSY